MSLLGHVLANEISDLNNPRIWMSDWAIGRRTRSGEAVGPESAKSLSVYWACIRTISEDIGKIPFITYKRLKRGKERAPKHPVFKLLRRRPNSKMNAGTFREVLMSWALGWGNGFAEIQRDGFGVPQALWPIHPSRMKVDNESQPDRIRYFVGGTGVSGTAYTEIAAQNVFHLRGVGEEDGGCSVLRMAAESIGLALAAQTFGSSFFANGSSVGGVITRPLGEEMTKEAMERLRKEWAEIYGGAENAGKPAILEDGMDWKRIGIPPEEAQFLETRQFQIEEICRWFRLAPHKVQHLLRSTFSNIAHQSIEHVGDTLQPWFTRWEEESQAKLFKQDEDDFFAEHLALGLLRGDDTARIQFYTGMFNIGSMSQNDIREAENMNDIGPEGDVYYVPLNMIRSEDAAEGKRDAAAAPANAPGGQPPGNLPPTAPGQDQEGGDDDEDEEDPEEQRRQERREKRREERRRAATAIKPVLAHTLDRLVQKEIKAVVRASEKHTGNRATFDAWAEKFYQEHSAGMIEAIKPIAQSVMTLVGELKFDFAGIIAEQILIAVDSATDLHARGEAVLNFGTKAMERALKIGDQILEEIQK